MENKKIDFYFIDKVNFHTRNFGNFINYVEKFYEYEYNNAYPGLKGRFGEYYYNNIKGLPDFAKYEDLYKAFEINNIKDINVIYNVEYKGYRVFDICKAEMNNYLSAKIYELYVNDLLVEKNENETLLEWLIRAYKGEDESLINIVYYNFAITAFWIDYWPKVFKNKKINNLCVFGGTTIFSRVANAIAKWNNINVIAFEGFFIKDFHYADNSSGMITNNHIGSNNSFIKSIEAFAFLDNQQKWLNDVMKNKSNLNVIQPIKVSKDKIYSKYKINKSKRIALLIGQVINDFSITEDLSTYESTVDFYVDVIKSFSKQKKYHLFIKLHPWENHKKHNIMEITKKAIEKKILGKGYKNYTIDYDINIDSLIDVSDFGITSCSQSGMEMLYEGKRVLQVGNASYGGKGWTIDVKDKKNINNSINAIAANPYLSEQELLLFKKYLYQLIYNHLFYRNNVDNRFNIKFNKLVRLNDGNSDQIDKLQNLIVQMEEEKIAYQEIAATNRDKEEVKNTTLSPSRIIKSLKTRINNYRTKDFKVVNMVMGNKVQSKIFHDMLNRFEKELYKNKFTMKVSVNPVPNADIYHYWRPNAIKIDNILHPAIATVHHDLKRDSESLTIRHFIDSYKASDLVLCLNNEQKSLLKDYLGDKKLMDVIPHGYDIRFKPKNKYSKYFNNDNKLVIGLSSRRYERLIKGEETLYKVIDSTKDLPIKWIFIGEDRNIEGDYCKKNGVECEVYENLDYSKYPELYSRMDLFLITSKAEGGPASLPEALACGVPVISTPCGFVPDMVINGENGFIVQYNDNEAITSCINKVINMPSLLEKMGKKCVNSDNLKSWELIINDYIYQYNRLLNLSR